MMYNAQINPIKLQNNRFSITLRSLGEFSYFQYIGGQFLASIQENGFLIQPGDSICMNLKSSQNIYFTGIGSEKLNYQLYVGKFLTRWIPYKGNDNSPERFEYYRYETSKMLRLAIDSLNKIKPKISTNTYNVLSFSTASAFSDFYLRHITAGYFNCDSIYKKLVKSELINMNTLLTGFASTDPLLIRNAYIYVSYLANFEITYSQVFTESNRPLFSDYYNRIKNQFSGLIRDQLITYMFLAKARKNNSSAYITDALNLVKDSTCIKILLQSYNSRTPGVKAYDFSLEDINGKKIKLNDFRGKLVIMDTWFNGCGGCIGLTKRMEPIFERYKNNKSIVFISVCVDKEKKKFEDGVKAGIYGFRNSIYVYTNGRGPSHPMLLYYQYVGYPNLLVIDKEGKIITADPPDPTNEIKKLELISLIDQNIGAGK